MNNTIRLVITTLAVLGFFAWAIFDVIQTQFERHDAIAGRAFDMAREYRGPLGATKAQFSDSWNDYLNTTVDSYNGGNLDEKSYSDLVDRFLSIGNNNDGFITLSTFYEEVGECVDADLCDFWTVRTLFGDDIVSFYHNMYPVLEREHQEGHNVDGILSFVDRMNDADRGAVHRAFEFGFMRSNPDHANAR